MRSRLCGVSRHCSAAAVHRAIPLLNISTFVALHNLFSSVVVREGEKATLQHHAKSVGENREQRLRTDEKEKNPKCINQQQPNEKFTASESNFRAVIYNYQIHFHSDIWRRADYQSIAEEN